VASKPRRKMKKLPLRPFAPRKNNLKFFVKKIIFYVKGEEVKFSYFLQ